jgi:L-cysteine S-thiosulfotransferase
MPIGVRVCKMTPSSCPSPLGEKVPYFALTRSGGKVRCFTLSPWGEGWGEGVLFALILTASAVVSDHAYAGETQMERYEIAGDAIPKPLGGLKGDPRRGEAIVLDRREGNCLICHRFPFKDEPFQGEIGPSLIGVGARRTEGQIRLRLVDESRMNPETLMPPYYRVADLTNVAPEYEGKTALTAQQLEDVVAYLSNLKE